MHRRLTTLTMVILGFALQAVSYVFLAAPLATPTDPTWGFLHIPPKKYSPGNSRYQNNVLKTLERSFLFLDRNWADQLNLVHCSAISLPTPCYCLAIFVTSTIVRQTFRPKLYRY
ncbi:hypothetical protein LCGC14_1316930 [marine sediment metagenome]|uniref:Uncharacterized protein n=1 Tax=marine sediment metagenome TaxID=412755 RepID=A0A0F9N1G9_9ZZZZ